jgi:hypothetical protein
VRRRPSTARGSRARGKTPEAVAHCWLRENGFIE